MIGIETDPDTRHAPPAKATRAAEIELHARLAAEYEKRHRPAAGRVYHDWWNGRLLRRLPDSAPAGVLDLCCGTGVLLDALARRYPNAVGIDLSPDMLAASGRAPRVVRGDGARLPFGDATFDAAVCRGALHHLPAVEQGIAELGRVVRPGGRLVVSEPSHDALHLRLPRWAWRRWSARFGEHHHALPSRWLVERCAAAGFDLVARERFGYLAFPLCGMLDLLPLLAHVGRGERWARALIAIDEVIARIPLLRRESWGLTLVFDRRRWSR